MSAFTCQLYQATDTVPEEVAAFIFEGEHITTGELIDTLRQHNDIVVSSPQQYAAYNLVDWEQRRTREHKVYYVMSDQTTPIAYAQLHWSRVLTHSYPDFTPPGAPYYLNIGSLYVRPNMRKQHVATQLLSNINELARTKHYRALSLEVHADNLAALACYQKYGFNILETQWYGIPRVGPTPLDHCLLLRASDAVKLSRFHQLLDEQLRYDGLRWPLLDAYRQQVKHDIIKKIETLELPVLMLDKGASGFIAISEIYKQHMLAGFPAVFAGKALTNNNALRACFRQWRTIAQKCYKTDVLHYSTLSDLNLTGVGLIKTYYVLTRHVSIKN